VTAYLELKVGGATNRVSLYVLIALLVAAGLALMGRLVEALITIFLVLSLLELLELARGE